LYGKRRVLKNTDERAFHRGPVPLASAQGGTKRHYIRRISGYLNPVYRSIDPQHPTSADIVTSSTSSTATLEIDLPAAQAYSIVER
jgi:hypothetical protein